MKHPKEYDSTPETRKRMSKVKLKNGKAETLLAKNYGIWDTVIEKTINVSLVLPISFCQSTISLFFWTANFGTVKTGVTAKQGKK